MLVAVTAAVGLAMTPVGGWLVDRFGARRLSLPLSRMVSGGTLSLAFVKSNRTFRAYFFFGLVLASVGYAQIQVGFTESSINPAHVSARRS